MLMRSTLSRLPKEKDHRVRVMGVLSAVVHIFNETAMHARAQASNRMAKVKQSKSWSKSEPSFSDKGKSKENNGKSKGKSKETKSAKQGAKGLLTQVQNIENESFKSSKLEIRDKLGKLGTLHSCVPMTLPGRWLEW